MTGKTNNKDIEILLPGGRVALYTHDAVTKAAFNAIASDWRFARVVLDVIEGDVDTAISMYQNQISPDLVIVQTDVIDDSLTEKLETLGANCAEGTEAIVIGPVNDVKLYRKLVGMGISDYLVRPVDTESLAEDIAGTLINKGGASGSRLIAVTGAKGGVGATALASNIAWGFAESFAQKTFLLDAAGGWSSLSVGLNFEPTATLAEAMRAASEQNEDALSRMVFVASDKLSVLSCGGDTMLDDTSDPAAFETLLDHMMVKYPVVVVDLSSASATMKRATLTKAHQIILVTAPTLASVRATRTLAHEIKQMRGGSGDDAIEIVVNMTGLAPKSEVTKTQIEQGLERKPSAIIPFDPGLFIAAEGEARHLSQTKDGKEIISLLLPVLSKALAGTGHEAIQGDATQTQGKKGGLGQILGRLKAKA